MSFPRYLVALIKAVALLAILDPGAATAQTIRESEAWAAARFINTPASYQWFLEMFPDGHYAMEAFEQLADRLPAQDDDPQRNLPYTTAWDWGIEDQVSDAMY